ncbi:DUF4192 domain-containing protein [Streptomyces gibsoniae]|uniref:DUF4192 domain-containing protein n=1 Tax=Streptomyces gibsoniae TaxID=3075529 RepID=A0ABU2TMH9_9ACTN|nr:DUF4192 domain-containing protein [Streptomyces sp. DSM 41699]MDT0462142.1 DUF4192 domain-containing protein [Streptomyces sp. DSM 41699]
MTNHDEAAGCSGIGDGGGLSRHDRETTAHAGHGPSGPQGEPQVTLRTPAELADALPYLLGYRPEDSIVLVALHDRERRGRFGGRARLGIPTHPDDWPPVAEQLARGLVIGSERRGAPPESMVAYLVQEPASGETGRDVMERLRPLAQSLRTACGSLDVPVVEALCISDGRFWSYCCPSPVCCPPEGQPMGVPGTSVLAAAATYAGLQVRGSLKEFRARLSPCGTEAARVQEAALDSANRALVPRILDGDSRADVAADTLALAERMMARLGAAPSVAGTEAADLRDDALLAHDEAAALILGLQDRTTRDRAAEWMEGAEAAVALRLWRSLARRCVGPYGEHAAAPLTLAGWVAWSTGDELEAREAFAMALGADPDYLFARLLHQACNEGLDPETVRRCLRTERAGRAGPDGTAAMTPGPTTPTADTSATSALDASTPSPLDPPAPSPLDPPAPSAHDTSDSSQAAVEERLEGAGPSAPQRVPARRRRRVRPGSGTSSNRPAPGAFDARRRKPSDAPVGDGPHRDRSPQALEGADSRLLRARRGLGRRAGEEAT